MTLDGEKKTGQDALPSQEGQPSPGDGSSPSGPTTYTTEQVEKLVKERHSTLDKEISSLGKQLRESQATVVAKESELADIAEERESLEKKLEDLSSGDPERFNLVKKDRELRERERKVKTETQALEVDKRTHSDRLTRIEAIERDIAILNIVDDYENANPEKLTELSNTLGAKTEEQLKAIADSFWTKKAQGSETPPITVDSGVTSGGAEDFSSLSPREKIDKGIEKLKTK